MRRRHFETLRPVCPVCKLGAGQISELRLAEVSRKQADHVIEGVLHCASTTCQREYPIIDGVPIIVRDIRQYLADNVLPVCQRSDFGPSIESMLGDCCGAGSAYDVIRQHLSSYAWDHYASQDPNESVDDWRPGAVQRVLEQGFGMLGALQPGPVLDVGCSVGGASFASADRFDQLVLGVDLNFSMLRLAQEILQTGNVSYPRRRVGLVYDRRSFPVRFDRMANVDFWACDVAALPFANSPFATAISLNSLDSVYSPLEMLISLAAVMPDGAKALFACPYDWSVSATPVEAWLGGHSQRSADAGDSEPVLRRLLSPGNPQSIPRWQILSEGNADWHVRIHERSLMSYKSHLVAAETVPLPASGS